MRLRTPTLALLLAGSLPLLCGAPARAEQPTFTVTLMDHRFDPAELRVPAGTRIRLVVRNHDATPAEFESEDFTAEKVIPAGAEAVLTVGPLQPGSYEFFDEFNEATTRGRLIVQ